MTRRTIADRLPSLLLVVALLAGCAETEALAGRDPAETEALAGRHPVERLRERAGQYWDARVKGDLLATYTLHEPAFRRAVPLTGFLQGRGATTVLEYELLGEKIEGELGIVKVKMKSTVTHPKLIKPVEPSWAEFEEQWVRVDGEWYRKFRFPVGEPYPAVDWDEIAARNQEAGPLPLR
jgi:hypothetical protein